VKVPDGEGLANHAVPESCVRSGREAHHEALTGVRVGRESMSQGRDRVRQVAKARKKERFTALLHHVTAELLKDAYFSLKRDAASGVDGLTWRE